jgi:hypothetical protein
MNHHFNEAVIAKMTVKKVLHQIDYIETLIAVGQPGHDIKLTLADWFTEIRVHLRRLEVMTEQSVMH